MYTSLKYFLLIILPIALFSCDYPLFEYYDNPVNKDVQSPEVSIVKLDLEADTLYCYSGRKIQFSFTTNNQKIQGVKLRIDGLTIDSIMGSQGILEFKQYDVDNGIHKLELLVFTESGTGSIADKLGAESWVISREWVLLMDNTRSNNTRYEVRDGLLNIQWDVYRAADFKSYVLQTGEWNPVTLTETQELSFTDSTYIGVGRKYTVYVKKENGDLLGWGSVTMPSELPDVKMGLNNNGQYYFYWKKLKYYKALQSYYFQFNNVKTESFNVADTTFVLTNTKYDDYINFNMCFVPRNGDPFYTHLSYNYIRSFADRVSEYKLKVSKHSFDHFYQLGKDVIGWFADDTLYQYNVRSQKYKEKTKVLEGYRTYGQPSPNFKFFLGYYSDEPNVFKYFAKNMATGQMSRIYDYQYYTGGISQSFCISDVGNGIITNFQYQMIYDYMRQTPFRTLAENNNMKIISPDGRFFMSYSNALTLYEIDSASLGFHKLFTHTMSYSQNINFNPLNSNRVLFGDKNTVIYCQCKPFSILLNLQMASGENILWTDYYREEFLTGTQNSFRVRSLLTGEILKEVPLNFTPQNHSTYRLIDRLIISYYGNVLDLNK